MHKQHLFSLVLAAAVPTVLEPGKLPKRIKVLNWGENPNARKTRIFIGDKLLKSSIAPEYPFRTVPLDFEHNTVEGTPAWKESKEPRPVAGYGHIEIVPGDGVYLSMVSWTPLGIESAHNYIDVSAAPIVDKAGEAVGIMSVALCRTGAVPDMEFTAAPLNAWPHFNNNKGTSHMDYKSKLIALLGLASDASDEDIQAALDAAAKTAPDATDAIQEAVQAAVAPLSAGLVSLQGELLKRDKQAVLDAAKAEGKVVALSATAVGEMSLASLQEHVKALAVTVPLHARTPGNVKETSLTEGITPEARTIALSCGMDPDKVWPTKAK